MHRRPVPAATAELRALANVRHGAQILKDKAGVRGDASTSGLLHHTNEIRAVPGPIRPRDKLFFFAQLSVMIGAGVPIAVALEGIARQSDRLRLRKVLLAVLAHVEDGGSLSSGLANHPAVFESQAIQLVHAGETCGDLPTMLTRICRLLERDYEMRKKLKSALTYPLVMVALAITTIGFLFGFILPRFRSLYQGRENVLPKPTKLLMAAGDFVAAYWMVLAGAAVALITGAILFARSERGKTILDRTVLFLPIVGNVLRRFSLARSVRTLGALLHGGVPIVSALEIARDLASNRTLRDSWEYVRLRVKDGGRIYEGMAGQEWFPGTLVQMTAMGESSGALESVLVQVGEFYDREAEVAVADATALLEPLMVVVVGIVVGFIAMSIMLPIFNVTKLVHH